MGLYALSYELAAGWEIADQLTLSPSVFTQLPACAHYSATPLNPAAHVHLPPYSWSIRERTICCSAGRRPQGGYGSSFGAAVCPESVESGCFAEGGGGQTGGPLLRCGRRNRRGAEPGVARRGVGGVGCAETPGIPFLEKQTPVNCSVRPGAFGVNDSDANLLRAAEVDPILTVPIDPAGASVGTEWSESHNLSKIY